MVTTAARLHLESLREPGRALRVAAGLWIAWAIVVWNVVFDHLIVVAGRRYVYAAALAARRGGPHVRADDFMRPAVTHGFWIASMTATVLLAAGAALGWLASVGSRRRAR